MKYWLITLGLISAIDDLITVPSPKPSPVKLSSAEAPSTPSFFIYLKPEEIDYHCLHRILSVLSDSLYDIYYEYKNVKELLTTFEEEYGLDDAGIEKYTSSSFNKFMMSDNKPINDQLHEFQNFIRHLQSKKNQFSDDYKVSYLIDKLPSFWSAYTGDLRHKQGDLILVQALKTIRIEDQHRQNFKLKSELKAKVNLMEDNPKRKFMNPKGKKLKKPNQFHSSPHANSSSFKPLQISSFKPKTFGQKSMKDSAMSVGESITWRPNISTERRNQSMLNLEETEEMAGTKSTWWN